MCFFSFVVAVVTMSINCINYLVGVLSSQESITISECFVFYAHVSGKAILLHKKKNQQTMEILSGFSKREIDVKNVASTQEAPPKQGA